MKRIRGPGMCGFSKQGKCKMFYIIVITNGILNHRVVGITIYHLTPDVLFNLAEEDLWPVMCAVIAGSGKMLRSWCCCSWCTQTWTSSPRSTLNWRCCSSSSTRCTSTTTTFPSTTSTTASASLRWQVKHGSGFSNADKRRNRPMWGGWAEPHEPNWYSSAGSVYAMVLYWWKTYSRDRDLVLFFAPRCTVWSGWPTSGVK